MSSIYKVILLVLTGIGFFLLFTDRFEKIPYLLACIVGVGVMYLTKKSNEDDKIIGGNKHKLLVLIAFVSVNLLFFLGSTFEVIGFDAQLMDNLGTVYGLFSAFTLFYVFKDGVNVRLPFQPTAE